MKHALLLLILFSFAGRASAQSGCTDPLAQNYDPSATTNDGSCTYPLVSIDLTAPTRLPALLNETSALVFTDGDLWTLNDSGNAAAIYKIDPATGQVLQTVQVTNATNVDWEGLTADADFIYIGDFGNNTNGNRQNLRVYRVRKTSIGAGATVSVGADIIQFSYQDQVIQNPAPTGSNNTAFDCEAFLIKDNVLHLFTKDWITFRTRHYTLPPTPGTHVAVPVEEFDVRGLITGATLSPDYPYQIALIGYSANLIDLFMWVLYDYPADRFFSGNTRRFSLGKSIDIFNRSNDRGQIEGVSFTTGGQGNISSERISRSMLGVPLIVEPHLYSSSVQEWMPLPVELIDFRASASPTGVHLVWETASEAGSAYFAVERSADVVHFAEIGREKAAGHSSSLLRYRFTDPAPPAGTNYYRLKATDLDGTFAYSSVVHAIPSPLALTMRVYPVPVSRGEPFTVQLLSSGQEGSSVLTLTGMDGRLCFRREVAAGAWLVQTLVTDQLKPGVYLLQVTTDTQRHAAKVVVQ
jgi:hypothetical protein